MTVIDLDGNEVDNMVCDKSGPELATNSIAQKQVNVEPSSTLS